VRNNSFIIFLIGLAVILAGVLGWLLIKTGTINIVLTSKPSRVVEKTISKSNEFFPTGAEASLGGQINWKRSILQPVFSKTSEDKDGKYLDVFFQATASGEITAGKVFVMMQNRYIDENGVAVTISDTELMGKFKEGDQFGIYYVSQIPDDFSVSSEYCQNPNGMPVECLVTALQQVSNQNGTNIFYPMMVFRKLVD